MLNNKDIAKNLDHTCVDSKRRYVHVNISQ